ncbi:DUF559 domain-containing protein [Nakamurella antarctica]|uniref:DUF559 domain-containing protein n=1 Tax=Nakamurella antarctica TaxID=1902245 RepID=A0A3G8ZNG7_9ACTN|nr:type IV toxin-antitoxin system AbiEi family antitoxin domain-containing protein [Nakamurella antarctica]AZI58688.1 DUF559 domain-containing protein [Nakamurella antarctica]
MNLIDLAQTFGLDKTIELQEGLITRAQARATGLADRRYEQWVTRGSWRRLHPGVYLADSDAARDHGRTRVRATWLWAGERAVIAMDAAAWWWGVTTSAPTSVEVWIPPSQGKPGRSGLIVRRRSVPTADTRFHDGLQLTSQHRTAVDLSAVGNADVLDTLARLSRLRAPVLERTLDLGRGSRGWAAAREAVAQCATHPWSAAERRFHADLRAAGIGGWVANSKIRVGKAYRIPDLRFEDVPLLIEIDGFESHGTRAAFESDRLRDAEFTAVGWTVLRFTWRQIVNDPAWVVRTIRQTLSQLQGRAIPAH